MAVNAKTSRRILNCILWRLDLDLDIVDTIATSHLALSGGSHWLAHLSFASIASKESSGRALARHSKRYILSFYVWIVGWITV